MSSYEESAGVDYPEIIPRSRNDLTAPRLIRIVLYTLAVVIAGWHLYYAYTYVITELRHSNIHLAMLLSFFFLARLNYSPEDWRNHAANAGYLILTLGITATTVYVHFNFDRWLNRARALFLYTNVDLVVGASIMAIVLIATYLAFGRGMSGTILVIIAYALFGPWMPGFLQHSGMDIERIIFLNTISLTGIYGSLLGVAATVIFVFILYAGMAQGYGELDNVIRLSKQLSKYVPSGVPQVAVISSTIVGSFMGSTTANTATTGSFTIPLMKDEGVEPRTAAAIEGLASNVGQLLPPVMGTAAFLMADILTISYYDVIKAAVLPAIMFFMSTSVMVYLLAVKNDWGSDAPLVDHQSTSLDDEKSVTENLLSVSPLFVSLLVLIYILVILRYGPLLAAVYTTITITILALLRDIIFNGLRASVLFAWVRKTIEGFRRGAETMAPLTAVLAGLGIAIKIFSATGLAQKLALELLTVSGGSLVFLLLLAMGTTILFTMAMPTPAAYIFVAILTAPVLVQKGIEPLTAHMFVFYFADFSSIVPPVGLALVVAAGISGAGFWEVARECFRIGLFAFILPFTVVFHQNLLFWDSLTPLTYIMTLVGVVVLLLGTIGYNLQKHLSIKHRVVYVIGGVAIMLIQNWMVQLALATIAVGWLAFLYFDPQDRKESIAAR